MADANIVATLQEDGSLKVEHTSALGGNAIKYCTFHYFPSGDIQQFQLRIETADYTQGFYSTLNKTSTFYPSGIMKEYDENYESTDNSKVGSGDDSISENKTQNMKYDEKNSLIEFKRVEKVNDRTVASKHIYFDENGLRHVDSSKDSDKHYIFDNEPRQHETKVTYNKDGRIMEGMRTVDKGEGQRTLTWNMDLYQWVDDSIELSHLDALRSIKESLETFGTPANPEQEAPAAPEPATQEQSSPPNPENIPKPAAPGRRP
jgi:hypothetical protein